MIRDGIQRGLQRFRTMTETQRSCPHPRERRTTTADLPLQRRWRCDLCDYDGFDLKDAEAWPLEPPMAP